MSATLFSVVLGSTDPEPGSAVPNFDSPTHATAAHLDGLGGAGVAKVHQNEFALLGTVLDADGNHVQIVQLDRPG